jgi:uncharacterized protein (DUF1015 family)
MNSMATKKKNLGDAPPGGKWIFIMAKIVPFKGILYDEDKIGALKDVVAPPYDVISEQDRRVFFERHPQNVIRLILSKGRPDDTVRNNRYTRAADCFGSWLEKGALKRDPEPALYLTEMDFSNENEIRTRLGFIALVQLEDFDKGGILPHEKTFSATKADRLKVMEACNANFSPIFSLFSDPDGGVVGVLRAWMEGVEPDIDFKEHVGYRHRLWRVKDEGTCRKISEELADRPLFIADGHHRYETALNYRNRIVAKTGVFDPNAPYNFVMMYLNSMQDPGLVMRSVHRLLCQVPQDVMDQFVDRARAFFDLEVMHAEAGGVGEARGGFLGKIHRGADHGVMGAVVRGHRALYVLRVKSGALDHAFGGEIAGPLSQLDVTIATKLLLQKVLRFDDAALDDEKRIMYTSRTPKAFQAVDAGKCDVALILNPTRLSHVEEVSKAGLIMPRKSTYFFPKVLSGLVMNTLGD